MLSEVATQPIVVARSVYELFLDVFPTSSRHWIRYIDHEMKAGHAENVEALYKRCLRQCPDVELWYHPQGKCYLVSDPRRKYLRYVTDTLGENPEAQQEVVSAFEFALGAVGSEPPSVMFRPHS